LLDGRLVTCSCGAQCTRASHCAPTSVPLLPIACKHGSGLRRGQFESTNTLHADLQAPSLIEGLSLLKGAPDRVSTTELGCKACLSPRPVAHLSKAKFSQHSSSLQAAVPAVAGIQAASGMVLCRLKSSIRSKLSSAQLTWPRTLSAGGDHQPSLLTLQPSRSKRSYQT